MNSKCCRSIIVLSLAWGGSQNSYAFDWVANNLQLLYGGNFKLGAERRGTLTVEHSDGWKYGSNFFFADIIERGDMGTEVYSEVYSYLSLNKITQADAHWGLIQDVSLVAGLNIGNKPEREHYKAYLVGISFNLANPWFNYLQFDITALKDDNAAGRYGIQFTPVWSFPFTLANVHFKFRGFTDFKTANSAPNGSFQILAQPQLLMDVGDLVGWQKDRFYVGTEAVLWHNKFGIAGVDETAIQAMAITFF